MLVRRALASAKNDRNAGPSSFSIGCKAGCFAIKASGSKMDGSRGWIRTSTCGVLDAVPLPLGYATLMKKMAERGGHAPLQHDVRRSP